ncbi:DNA sulfur modification protein DndD [Tuberibacillus sp. Marseille-P3662]|uniref:DNA sulfur modification protein DndD n=1 Tax=Tuberibacillus sp. Marseille-P3662 TaxID=1965358 RepID=UPI000A1CC836|nr:DNA sulfur modification protein DndD [Tuberibacillus sp. Marseille-P3662]
MLLKQMTLENFGAYRGTKKIDLKINSSQRNTILIGGENGSGKTTLLNGIKIGLFGSYAYGFKTESSLYLNKIESFLNTQAIKNEENHFRVVLEFSEVENYKKTEYIFYRSWYLKNSKIKEELDIYKDNRFLNQSEKEIYQSKLRESMPPQLFDLCLFDGEEISRIISDNLLSTYLKKLSKVIFNLNLFESLENDLESLIKNKRKDGALSEQNKQIVELKYLIDNHQNEIHDLENSLSEQQSELSHCQDKLQELQKDFEMHGGLYKEQRDQLVEEVNKIENERKAVNTEVKEYVATVFPFYMNKDLLDSTVQQMEAENTQQIFDQMSNHLNEEKLNKVLNELPVSSNEGLALQLKDTLLKHIRPELEQSLHHASFAQRSQVSQMVESVNRQEASHYADLLKQNQKQLKRAQEIRKKINIHDKTNDFTQMIQQIEQLKMQISTLEQKIDDTQNRIYEQSADKDLVEQQLEEKQKERHQSHKQLNAFALSQDIVELSQEFRKVQQQKKLQEVESEAIRMLKQLMRKSNYITSIKIEPVDFDITLYDINQELIKMGNLSAGEKEILLLSLIWAMFKSSGRRVPFIFDTLLGRLDQTHKSSVLSELIPSCGEQVLILSTDTEIDQEHYKTLKPYLAHEYTLNFDSVSQEVNIESEYFMEKSGVSM